MPSFPPNLPLFSLARSLALCPSLPLLPLPRVRIGLTHPRLRRRPDAVQPSRQRTPRLTASALVGEAAATSFLGFRDEKKPCASGAGRGVQTSFDFIELKFHPQPRGGEEGTPTATAARRARAVWRPLAPKSPSCAVGPLCAHLEQQWSITSSYESHHVGVSECSLNRQQLRPGRVPTAGCSCWPFHGAGRPHSAACSIEDAPAVVAPGRQSAPRSLAVGL